MAADKSPTLTPIPQSSSEDDLERITVIPRVVPAAKEDIFSLKKIMSDDTRCSTPTGGDQCYTQAGFDNEYRTEEPDRYQGNYPSTQNSSQKHKFSPQDSITRNKSDTMDCISKTVSKVSKFIMTIFSIKFWYGLLVSIFPVIKCVKNYKIKEFLAQDVTAGITVGVVHLPQGMAYALLATLPVQNGLYVSIFPVLIYAFTGSSRHISIGTFAVSSLMIAAALQKFEPGLVDICNADESCITNKKVEISQQLAFLGGFLQIAMSMLNMGFITSYLSDFMINGFISAAALHFFDAEN